MDRKVEIKQSFKKRFQHQPIFREKFMYTIWICLAFVMLGLVEALFGPTFPDLRMIVHERLDTASWMFTCASAGFLVGSAATGFLYDKYNILLIIIIAITGMALTQIAIPYCSYFWLMLIVKCLSGLTAACLDTCGNTEIVNLWGSESGSYMQAVHFCFSLGGVIAPFIAQPFLTEQTKNDDIKMPMKNETKSSFSNNVTVSSPTGSCGNSKVNSSEAFGDTDVEYAYVISAVMVFVTVIPFCCLYYIKRKDMARKGEAIVEEREPTDFSTQPVCVKILMLLLLASLMCVYCGTEDTYAGYLMTFLTSELCWSKTKGSVATSVYWICFGGARLFCIPLTRYFRTEKLMITFSMCLVLSYTGLLLAKLYQINFLLWIFIGAPGVAMSFLFPAMFSWTNDNVVNVSGKISSLMMTSASVGIMSFPLLFGYTMEHLSQMWFIYLLLSQSILWVVLFAVFCIIAKCLLKNTKSFQQVTVGEEGEPIENSDDYYKVVHIKSESTKL